MALYYQEPGALFSIMCSAVCKNKVPDCIYLILLTPTVDDNFFYSSLDCYLPIAVCVR